MLMAVLGPGKRLLDFSYCQELCRQVSDALNPYSSGFVQCSISLLIK